MTQTDEWTVSRLLQWTAEYLETHGSDSPRLDAEVLLGHACECPRIQLYARYNEPVAEDVRATFRETVKQRAGGAPVAYLVGAKEFYSLSFKVTPDVLIPRPETETLVLEALEVIKVQGDQTQVIDLGTGSGAIAICLAKYSKCQVTAVDISAAALRVASENAVDHQVAERIRFVESDLFSGVEPGRFDVIASNPPYVSEPEFCKLDVTVKEYEPRTALVAGERGDEVFQRIVREAPDRLKPQGWLFIELSPMLADQCLKFARELGCFSQVEMVNDLSGAPRILRAQARAS